MPMNPRLLIPRASGLRFNPNNLVLVYDTSLEPANNTISVPINNVTGSPNVTINWGDGTTSTATTNGFVTKTYANPGIYTVQVSGTMTRLSYGAGTSTANNRAKLLRCLSFGNLGITTLDRAFQSCANMIECPATLPTGVTDLNNCFVNCSAFNDARVSGWNVSNCANFSFTFFNATLFGAPLDAWDIRKSTTFNGMLSTSAMGTAKYDAILVAWADLADTDLTIGTTANTSQAITAFATLSAGTQTRVTSNGHGLVAGSRVNISGTTNYNGDFNVLAAAANTFDIAVAFVANDATGTMKHRRSRNVTAGFGGNKYSAGAPTTARGVLTGTYSWSITDGGQV
jgi:hypothetical protein